MTLHGTQAMSAFIAQESKAAPYTGQKPVIKHDTFYFRKLSCFERLLAKGRCGPASTKKVKKFVEKHQNELFTGSDDTAKHTFNTYLERHRLEKITFSGTDNLATPSFHLRTPKKPKNKLSWPKSPFRPSKPESKPESKLDTKKVDSFDDDF